MDKWKEWKGYLHPKTAIEIYGELEEARACYDCGEYEAFDEALDEISKKYNFGGYSLER